jgi:hypothetical protein
MNHPAALLCLVLAALLIAPATVPAEERFQQDRFAIGLWVDPPLDEQAEARYQDLADANFNMVIGGFGGVNLDTLIALCEKHDLKLIADGRGVDATTLPVSPAIWGYALRDEPGADEFPTLREKADAVRRERPGKLPFINLFPNYADESQLKTPTYEEHVRLFMEIVEPEVLSMDHYPQFHPGRDGRAVYCENIDILRTYSMKAGVPFWNFFNIMPYGPQTDPTEAQVRWQIYTSLAYGAKGVMYFCYFTPQAAEFSKGGAIIHVDGRKSRHYGEAQRINAELEKLGPVIMQLTSEKVVHVDEAAGDVPAEKLAGLPITNLERAPVDPKGDYLVGAFKHTDGRRAVLLNNYHFAYTAWPTVTFDAPLESVIEVDKYTGEQHPVIDDSPLMEGIQISLGAGDGRLFLLP